MERSNYGVGGYEHQRNSRLVNVCRFLPRISPAAAATAAPAVYLIDNSPAPAKRINEFVTIRLMRQVLIKINLSRYNNESLGRGKKESVLPAIRARERAMYIRLVTVQRGGRG